MKTQPKKPINYDQIAFVGICVCLYAMMHGANPWLCSAIGFAFGCLVSNPENPAP